MKILKHRILIVEDNKDTQFLLSRLLEFSNYESVIASNGKDALLKLLKMKKLPDLIMSDIGMPIMDGLEFFKEVSNSTKLSKIPFIFLTARSSPEDISYGRNLGVDDYITKPIGIENLILKIKRLIPIKHYGKNKICVSG